MILISAGLVLAAVVLLIAGFVLAAPHLIMWSIVVSVLSAMFLVIGAFLRRHELFPSGGRDWEAATPPHKGVVPPTSTGAQPPVVAHPPMAAQHPAGAPRPAGAQPPSLTPRTLQPTATAPAARPQRPAVGGISPDSLVLVIPGRKRYHVAGCRQLIGRDHEELTYEEAREEGFTPCTTCLPDAALGGRQLPPVADPEPAATPRPVRPAPPAAAESRAEAPEVTRELRSPVARPQPDTTAPAPAAPTPAEATPSPAAETPSGSAVAGAAGSGTAEARPGTAEPRSGTAEAGSGTAEQARPSGGWFARPADEQADSGETKPAKGLRIPPYTKPSTPVPEPATDTERSDSPEPAKAATPAATPKSADEPPGKPEPVTGTKAEAPRKADPPVKPEVSAKPEPEPADTEQSEAAVKDSEPVSAQAPKGDGAKPSDDAKGEPSEGDDEEPGTVKVIVGTRRYHSTACPLIRGAGDSGVETMSLAEAEAAGLTSCSVCQNDRETVS